MAGGLRFRCSALADATCSITVAFAETVSAAILLATALYVGWCATQNLPAMSVVDPLLMLPFIGTVVAGRGLRKTLKRGPSYTGAHAWFLGFALASMLMSFSWFQDPMHDIALPFGSHGRWGCQTVNDDGSPAFLLRDSTVPMIVFLPALLTTGGHWIARRRRRLLSVS